jgi:hypothetical protein
MSTGEAVVAPTRAHASAWRRAAPVVTLFLLPALMIEILYGSTRVSVLYLAIPEVLVYGSAALLVRALVRRRGPGPLSWPSVLLLGLAFSVAEEIVVLQFSLNPYFLGGYGRVLGVNTVYFLAMLGYESLWAIAMPIALVEAIFPDRRHEPWLGLRGMAIAAALLCAGFAVAWYSWTSFGLPLFSHGRSYTAPAATVIVGLAAVVALAALALGPWAPRVAVPARAGRALRPWLMGVAAFWLALAWLFVLVLLAFFKPAAVNPALAIAGGLLWAAGAALLVRRWAGGSDFGDRHRVALVFGALVASWLQGFVVVASGSAVDVLGKLVLDLVGVALLAVLAVRVGRRPRQPA